MSKHYFLVVLLSVSFPSSSFSSIITSWFSSCNRQEEFMAAVLVGQVKKVGSLLYSGVNPNFIDKTTRNTPLGAICASTQMNTATKKTLIILLLAYKADITMLNGWEKTPLAIAEQHGDPDIIAFLKEKLTDNSTD